MADEQTQESEGTTEAPEMVPVEEAPDDVIDALSSGEMEFPDEEPEEEPQPEVEEEKTPAPAPAEKPQAAAELRKQLGQFQELLARVERSEKETKGQELLIQRQLSRWGAQRKNIEARIAQLKDGLGDRWIENPQQAADDAAEIREAQKALQAGDAEAQNLARTQETRQAVAKHIKADEYFPDEIEELLVEDGVPPHVARAFVADPTSSEMGAPFIIQAAKRARERKALKYLVPAFERLKTLYLELQKKHDELSKNGPRDILKKVERAAKEPPRLNGKSSGTRSRGVDFSRDEIAKLGEGDLDALVESFGRG